jgi:hypothetical protein
MRIALICAGVAVVAGLIGYSRVDAQSAKVVLAGGVHAGQCVSYSSLSAHVAHGEYNAGGC